jgi:RHH-type transcriptional regulator, rel operon repressor / antitoxin RelB
MIALRLDAATEQAVVRAAKRLGITKSELIRESIAQYVSSINRKNAWELGRELFEKHASGNPNLAADAEKILRDRSSKWAR